MPGNLYRRGATWYARIQVRGRDYRESLRTASIAVARGRLKAILEKAEHFRFHGESRHTWKEAVVEWSKAAPDQVGPGTVKRYLVSLGQVRTFLDGLYVDEIGRKKIAEIARRPGVTNATRRRDLTAISSVLRWCVAQGWRDDNPARDWSREAIPERRDPIALPELAHIDLVIADAPGNFAKLIRWALVTGMREEECASLERPMVNEKRKAADIKGKGNKRRSVPLDERALGAYAGTVAYLGSRVVFWHGAGERYMNVASRFAEITERVAAKAQAERKSFRRFRFHDLRHRFAVDYLRGGGGIYDLQKILGHSSIKTTEIYLDFLTPEEAAAAKRSAQKPAQQ